MRGQAPGRVIVGVEDSLAGLQALREATKLAKSRGMEILAVRACSPLPAEFSFDCWPTARPGPVFIPQPSAQLRDAGEQLARVFVEHAFNEAMGGIPDDVPVHTTISYEPPHRALTAVACRDADLLIIGASRHHHWWPFRRSPARYCAGHAVCPVLIVPPHQGVSELNRASRPWRLLRRKREFSDLTAGI